MKKTVEQIREIVEQVSFKDRTFLVAPLGHGAYLQVQYWEKDIDTGIVALQKSRKWYISKFATETEIVETAFAAVMRSMAHVVKEHFTYQGRRVYSPHFDVEARIELCDAKRFDAREEPK